MFTPAPDTHEPDLVDLAATLAGCAPVDLLKVRRDPAGLVVILATGQKYVFDTSTLGEDIDTAIRAQLARVLGVELPAPTPAAKAKGSKAR